MWGVSTSSEVKVFLKRLKLNDFGRATIGIEACFRPFCANSHLTSKSSLANIFCGTNLKLWELVFRLSGFTVLKYCVHHGEIAASIQVLVMLVFLCHPVVL